MAQILTTKALAAALERVIRKADNELFLISYAIKIEESYIRRIKHAAERGVMVKVVFGETLKKESLKELERIANIEILRHPGLHAKIFANNSECIIGSMNLYEYSEHHNTELGCLITLKDDKEAFEDALSHCREIYEDALTNIPDTKTGITNMITNGTGFCISTGVKIPFNIEKPMSLQAYKIWKKEGSDREAKGKFCHFSGEPSNGENNINKPVIAKYWKKSQAQQHH